MDWMYNFNFTTDKVMRASWILAHPPSDLNGHRLSSAGTSGRGKKEGVVPRCLFNVQGSSLCTRRHVLQGSHWCESLDGADNQITAQMRANGGQQRGNGPRNSKSAACLTEACLGAKHWSCSLFICLNFAGNCMIMTGGSCTKHLNLKFALRCKLRS